MNFSKLQPISQDQFLLAKILDSYRYQFFPLVTITLSIGLDCVNNRKESAVKVNHKKLEWFLWLADQRKTVIYILETSKTGEKRAYYTELIIMFFRMQGRTDCFIKLSHKD